MRSFFKIFLASLSALVVFCLILIFLFVALAGSLAKRNLPRTERNSVLVLDLGQKYREQVQQNPVSFLSRSDELDIPGLYDVVRLINKAMNDKNIAGIYIKANSNPNGFATSAELRDALVRFKQSKKFVIAHGDVMSQKAYFIASAADQVYVLPNGYFEWSGFGVDLAFFKGSLEKLAIQPQVFYAGKFKSATEPFRTDKMTEANREQTASWLNDLYDRFLETTARSRKLNKDEIRQMAVEDVIRNPGEALQYGFIDGLKYDDELKDEIKDHLGLGKYNKINFISINKYYKTGGYKKFTGDRVAVIYAEGDIIDGRGRKDAIAGEDYRQLIRKARLDRNIKAIVLRVNSGGGSTLASEMIWRELYLAEKEKPVVVSFGDVAASGGYYISCAADSIFASPYTLTGSIGVFSIIPNMENFFKNKLGVTFDRVKTGPYADNPSITREMTAHEKEMRQREIDHIYSTFKQRVADGRKKDSVYIESIAQGRVWSGGKALELGLIDREAGLDEAIASAAGMAGLKDYTVKEYPEPMSLFDQVFGSTPSVNYEKAIIEKTGEENYHWYTEVMKLQQIMHQPQSRLPFQFFIH